MHKLNEILSNIDGYIGSSEWFVYFLLLTGLFFTLYLGLPQIRYFRHAIKIVKGKFDRSGDEGDTSHFQALATALSGTVGTGNIGGVALAIHVGGPAALFWMLMTALLGMCTKFVEVTLSHKYREKADDGTMAGGPMYYMKNARFTLLGKPINFKFVAVIFAIATVISSFGTGNMPQINSIAAAMKEGFNIDEKIVGGVLAVLLGFVIIGGIKRIAKVTEKLVPFMAITYVLGAFVVIFTNYENIIPSVVSVFSNLFSGSAALGGFLGASFSFAFNKGVGRGLFSNEAGQGSAPIAHASAKGHEPVSEGMVAILEPFIDTIIICSITGLVILSSGVWNKKYENNFQSADTIILSGSYSEENDAERQQVSGFLLDHIDLPKFSGDLEIENGTITSGNITILNARSFAEDVSIYQTNDDGTKVPYSGSYSIDNGKPVEEGDFVWTGKSLIHTVPLTTAAFTESALGDFGKYIVAIGLLLFAFSTAISWSYYGDRAITFLVGNKGVVPYRIVYIIAFFFAAFTDTTIIWTFSALAIALMTIPNLIGIIWLRNDMKSTVKQYWIDFRKDCPNEK